MTNADIAGRRILVVEDEPVIGLVLADMLEELGAEVDGPWPSAAEALSALVDERPAAALLDLHIEDGTSLPVADRLAEAGIPFAFLSGSGQALGRHADAVVLEKPYRMDEVAGLLRRLLG
jgi:DNA-binding response OmpR family regulator